MGEHVVFGTKINEWPKDTPKCNRIVQVSKCCCQGLISTQEEVFGRCTILAVEKRVFLGEELCAAEDELRILSFVWISGPIRPIRRRY